MTEGLGPAPETDEEREARSPKWIAPIVTWLSSDDAADCHGEVFRVGGGTVFLLKGWHTVGKVRNPGTWEPEKLGAALRAELAKGITAKENMMDVMGAGL